MTANSVHWVEYSINITMLFVWSHCLSVDLYCNYSWPSVQYRMLLLTLCRCFAYASHPVWTASHDVSRCLWDVFVVSLYHFTFVTQTAACVWSMSVKYPLSMKTCFMDMLTDKTTISDQFQRSVTVRSLLLWCRISEILSNIHPLRLGSVVMLWDVHVLITSVCAASRDLIWVSNACIVSLQGLGLSMGNEFIGAYMCLKCHSLCSGNRYNFFGKVDVQHYLKWSSKFWAMLRCCSTVVL